MANFIQLTRVYKLKGLDTLKTQTILVETTGMSMRASNRLGYPEHRATVTLASGQEIDVVEDIKALAKLAGVTLAKKTKAAA